MIADCVVHLVRFERTTFPFGGERSNPTELQVRELILYPKKMRRVQGSNLLELALIGFRNQRITVLPTLQKSEPGAIRTRDLLLRKQLLYPAELRTHKYKRKLTSVYFTL